MNGSTHDPLRKIQAQQPPETKADIGGALKAARQKRGHSIEAVVSHTRIPKKFVDALENNRLEEFPALAYLRGFLKTYCDYLEVDFDALWKQLQPPAPAPEEAPKDASAKHAASGGSPSHAPSRRELAHGGGDGIPAGALGALAVAALVALVLALTLRRGGEEDRRAGEAPPVTPAALEPVNKQAGPSLSLEFLDQAWVSVEPDGKIAFEGFVPRNSRQDWKAKKTILLRTSHPEALRLTLNGAKYALPSSRPDGAYIIEAP